MENNNGISQNGVSAGDKNVSWRYNDIDARKENASSRMKYDYYPSSNTVNSKAQNNIDNGSRDIVDNDRSFLKPDNLLTKRKGQLKPSAYTLPHVGDPRNRFISTADVIREFSKLDINGEGRLTFLTVRSALGFMGVSEDDVDDTTIRGWLREYDMGNKGYVDMEDFYAIYSISDDDMGESHTGYQRESYRGTKSENLETSSDDRRMEQLRR
jgi:hypothetical protein